MAVTATRVEALPMGVRLPPRLAPKITDRIYEIIRDIRATGVTVLVVEQNADRALKAADRTYVLNGGCVRLTGTAAELAGHPEFEAAYFGLSGRRSA